MWGFSNKQRTIFALFVVTVVIVAALYRVLSHDKIVSSYVSLGLVLGLIILGALVFYISVRRTYDKKK